MDIIGSKRQFWNWHCQIEDMMHGGSVLVALLAPAIKNFYLQYGPAIEQIKNELDAIKKTWCETDDKGKVKYTTEGKPVLRQGKEPEAFANALKEFFDRPHKQGPILKVYSTIPQA